MGTIVLLCGRVCSGKSRYAKLLEKQRGAVILSCDEMMLRLFDERLGDRHGAVLERTQAYLVDLARRIAAAGPDVVLDFGFWSRAERDQLRRDLTEGGFPTQLHEVRASPERLEQNLRLRNARVRAGEERSYYIDEAMWEAFLRRFEPPAPGEADVVWENI